MSDFDDYLLVAIVEDFVSAEGPNEIEVFGAASCDYAEGVETRELDGVLAHACWCVVSWLNFEVAWRRTATAPDEDCGLWSSSSIDIQASAGE